MTARPALVVYPIPQSTAWYLLVSGALFLGLCLLRKDLIEMSPFAHCGFAPALITSKPPRHCSSRWRAV